MYPQQGNLHYFPTNGPPEPILQAPSLAVISIRIYLFIDYQVYLVVRWKNYGERCALLLLFIIHAPQLFSEETTTVTRTTALNKYLFAAEISENQEQDIDLQKEFLKAML